MALSWKRNGDCVRCGWCCERTLYYDYEVEVGNNEAIILSLKKCNTNDSFIKKVNTWIEAHEMVYEDRRVVKIEVGCEFFKWKYNDGMRKGFCTVYKDKEKGCQYDKRKSFPESVNDLSVENTCGYTFEKK